MVAIDGLAREERLLHSLVVLKYSVDTHSAFLKETIDVFFISVDTLKAY